MPKLPPGLNPLAQFSEHANPLTIEDVLFGSAMDPRPESIPELDRGIGPMFDVMSKTPEGQRILLDAFRKLALQQLTTLNEPGGGPQSMPSLKELSALSDKVGTIMPGDLDIPGGVGQEDLDSLKGILDQFDTELGYSAGPDSADWMKKNSSALSALLDSQYWGVPNYTPSKDLSGIAELLKDAGVSPGAIVAALESNAVKNKMGPVSLDPNQVEKDLFEGRYGGEGMATPAKVSEGTMPIPDLMRMLFGEGPE